MATVVGPREKRDRLMLHALVERRLGLEEEARMFKARASELTHKEAELRDEVATLDAILGATPPPAPVETPTAATAPASMAAPLAAPSARKRRRKGSRLQEMLPKMRTAFASVGFNTEQVAEMIEGEEASEYRKAYFAAWSLVRDLLEDGALVVASEEGSGPRRKRTYRFTGAE